MATNWSAYEAAKELYGNNVENIQDIGSRFPLFSRAVMAVNDEQILDILGAIPKVTARVVETGLKTIAEGAEPEIEKEEKEEKKSEKKAPAKKTSKKAEPEPEEDEDEEEEEADYESMTAKDLYKLCCERGISGKCKERNKAYLIKVLKENDGEDMGESDDDEWDEEENTDPYEGKGAKELYKMCLDRKIKAKPKMKAAEYVKLLKKADEAEAEEEETDDDDDEWDI